MSDKRRLALVVGVGEGLGASLVKQLASQGYFVVGLNRSHVSVSSEHVTMLQLDASDSKTTKRLVNDVIEKYGIPEVLVHNTAQLYIRPFEKTSVEQFENSWQSMVLSAFNVMKVIVPKMAQLGRGTVIVSGATASLRAGANFSAFASAKFALRGLVQSVAREYQKQGVHIAHVILDGILDTQVSRSLHSLDPSDMMSTNEVADVYLQLIQQKPSAWTHELDLRPINETF
jgi:NAD(P)-dependent dehydrogenase (short-subunit alcohol dehydrogenase family)